MQTIDAIKVAPAASYVVTHAILGWPWGTLASMAAFVYSALMIGEWLWRKVKAWRVRRQIRRDDEARRANAKPAA